MPRKYSPSASKDVEREMHKFKRGQLKSGRGGKGGTVKSRKQAIGTFGGQQKGQEGSNKKGQLGTRSCLNAPSGVVLLMVAKLSALVLPPQMVCPFSYALHLAP